MTNKNTFASIVLLASTLSVPLKAETIAYHFDSPEEIRQFNPQFKDPSALLETTKTAAGAGALKTTSFSASFPKDWNEGVLSFWAYDDTFEEVIERNLHRIYLTFVGEVDGKKKNFGVELRRFNDGWRLATAGESPTSRYHALNDAPNHGGWTRFDIVSPACKGPRPFTIYIDGHAAFQTPDKYLSIASIGTENLPFVDEVVYDSNPDSFRPNPVQNILPDQPYGQVLLNPGQKLKVDLELDPKGARADSGEVNVVLLDGRCETLVSANATIDWKKGKKFSVELPTPPRSGNFWLETRYQEAGRPTDTTRRKINLQFINPSFAQSTQKPLELFRRPWDFLPIGKNEFLSGGLAQANSPTKEDLAVPNTPPTDWSQATPLRGPWLNFGNHFNIGRTYHAGWYRQRVEVPATWKGQQILLEIEAPETIATVFANGKRAGTVEWPGGDLDLTSFVTPGKTLDLAIHVQAEPVSGYFRLARECIGEKFQVPRYCGVRGLTGDVRLFPVAKGPRIDGVAIRTSVAKKQLTTVFEFSNLSPGKSYRIKSAASAAGQIAQALPETTFTAMSANDTVEISTAWESPVLWDLNAPYLYDLDAVLLDASGKTLASLWPERFGFREVTGNGPDLKINGRPVSLFITGGAIAEPPEQSRWCEKFGYSAFYDGEGKENARLLDEAGKTATGERGHMEAVQSAPSDMAKNGKESDPKFWAGVVHLLDVANKVRRNHPGVFFQRGVLAGQTAGNGGMYNPCFQNGTWMNEPLPSNDVLTRSFKVGRRIIDQLHQGDPTRLVSAQDSGSINDTMHITEYAGFLPIQEMIERTQYWRAHGTKPFLIEEQAAPMFPNWTDACSQGEGWGGVPCFAEWSAITLGDDAYARTPLDETYLQTLEKAVAQQRQNVIDTIKNPLARDVALAKIRMTLNPWVYVGKDDVMQNVIWKDRIREEVLNWRANHLAMLGFFFSNGGPRLDLCYQEYQAPVTGFLAGTKDKPTLKTHIFVPGETLNRGALLLNNSNKPAELTCQWKLELGGKLVTEGSKTETIPAGGDVFVPIQATIPAGGDQSGKLSVTFVKDGKPLRSDSCSIDVIAPRPFVNQGKVALIDPEGDSAKALEAAGVKFQLLNFDENFTSFDTIIFGRRAFNYEFDLLPEGLDLAKLMREGKRVLILEQDEAALRERFKLRTEYLSPREAYGRGGLATLLDGLPDRLLTYWRGSATLTDGYEIARSKGKPGAAGEFGDGGTWLYTWNDGEPHTRPMKWGNTHNVATVVAIKPDTGSFRTLLDCGYANNYAAAWELQSENGTILFNQVDVSGRSEASPEATRYLQNLVRTAENMPKPNWRQVVYLGGEKGADLLKQLSIPTRSITAPSEAQPDRDLLVLGDCSAEQLKGWKDAIAAFANAGGTVFSLPRTEDDFAAGWTPFAVKTSKRPVNHTLIGKSSAPLLAGLGNSDLYWKGNIEIASLKSVEGSNLLLDTGILASVPWGKGQYVFCQIEPAAFGDIKRDHWLKDSKRYTERMIRTLLTNLGAKMDDPKLLARPKASEEMDYALDLSGAWKVCPIVAGADAAPAKNDPAWRDIKLPGSPQRDYPEWKGVKGGFWFRRELVLEKDVPRDLPVRLGIGCISGSNILSVNGEKVARTDTETDVNGVATVVRDYSIPGSAFKKGPNELLMRVDYDTNAALGMRGSTGEVAAPMELRVFKAATKSNMLAPIDLESLHAFQGIVVQDPNAPCPDLNRTHSTLPWHRVAVPGYVQTQHADWANFTGYFWYWRIFTMNEPLPENAQPVLIMGAVDDEDTTYFNGVKIGHTGKDTNPTDYYKARRSYPIPKELFKPGSNANLIQVQLHDLNDSGGICKGPFRIIFEDPEVTQKRKLAERPYLYDVGRKDDPYWHHGF